jgi:hypothetical protein
VSKLLKLSTGKEIFQAACIGCHGPDGKGQPQTTSGFEPPATFPDFTDCNATTRETDETWRSIIHLGGRARGFSEIMPSFTEALSGEQIDKVIGYLRGFCQQPAWPLGELNFPRAIVTEKAYPEDEVVLTTTLASNGSAQTNTLVYEKRLGVGNQIEVIAPISVQRLSSGGRVAGIGDLTLGFKRLIASSRRTGSIFSLAGEVNLPTGNRARGLGTGTTVFETFAAFGQLLPHNSFVQTQVGAELPTNTARASQAVFWRTAVGSSVAKKNFGRLFTPMVEVIADRNLQRGAKTNWDVHARGTGDAQQAPAHSGERRRTVPGNEYGRTVDAGRVLSAVGHLRWRLVRWLEVDGSPRFWPCAQGRWIAADSKPRKAIGPQFQTSDRCIGCHNWIDHDPRAKISPSDSIGAPP